MSRSDSEQSSDNREPKRAKGTLSPGNAKGDAPSTTSSSVPFNTSAPDTTNGDDQPTAIFSASDFAKSISIDGFTIDFSAKSPSDLTKTQITSAPVASSLPGFKLLEELGRGAYGVVFRAQDEMLQRQVAIKMPLFRDPKLRDSYIAEARKSVALEHNNIVPVYHVGLSSDNQPFVVQKLIDGPTLRKVLAESKGLPILQSVRLLRDVALAVDAAHAAGIVHRDLKPENLLIDSKGNPWVADFGLALAEDDQTKHRGEIAGTPCYMSPEQLVGRADWLDGRSDIWSLGVMLYEMLVGKLPFEGANFQALKEQICEREPRPIHQRVPDVPRELDQIFQKCCAKRVTDRYDSARELAIALDDFLATTELTEDFSPSSFKSLFTAMGDARSTKIVGNKTQGRLGSTGRSLNTRSQQSTTIRRTIDIGTKAAMPLALILSATSIVCALWLFWQMRKSELAEKDAPEPIAQSPSNPTSVDQNITVPPGDPAPPQQNPSVAPTTPPDTPPQPPVQPDVVATPPVQRPFRVAIDGSGTHTSLQKAIDDAEPNEVIYIVAGTMRESVVVKKNVQLKGADRSSTVLTSVGKPCLVVDSNVSLDIENMTLSSQGDETNTIEVAGGSIQLRNCELFAASYDCLKLFEKSTATLTDCTLDTTEHPAIRAESESKLTVQSCLFRFAVKASSKAVGIQAVSSECHVIDSKFQGLCQAAVHVKDTQDQPVEIKSCEFRNSNAGVFLANCAKFSIAGEGNSQTKFIACNFPIVLRKSIGTIEELDIQYAGGKTGIGIQALQDSDVTIKKLQLSGYDIGIGVLKAKMNLSGSTLRECGHAIFSDSSKVTVANSEIKDTHDVGVIATGIKNELVAESVQFLSCVLGLYVMAGNATLDDIEFENIDTSIVIGSSEKALQEMRESSLYSIKGLQHTLTIDFSIPPVVSSTGLRFTSIKSAIRFIGPGKTRIKQVTPEIGATITLLDVVKPLPQTLRVNGTSLADLEVVDAGSAP